MLSKVRSRIRSVATGSSLVAGFPTAAPTDSATQEPPQRARPWPLLRYRPGGLWGQRDFLKFWAGESVSELGSQVTLLALPLLAALNLDASPAEMGLLGAAGTAPFLLLSLPVGVWVDRVRRRPLLIAADLCRVPLLLSIPLLWLLGWLRIDLLYLVAFLSGSFRVVYDIAYVAYLPSLVGREQLIEGNSKLRASSSAAQVIGPGVAGALSGLIGAALAILVDAVSFALSGFLLLRIKAREALPARPIQQQSMARQIGSGFRLAVTHSILRALTFSSATTTLFGYLFLSVYVLYMTDDLGLGAGAVGIVFGVGGVGAFIGALLAGPLARRVGIGPTIIWSRVLTGLGGAPIPLAVAFPALALPLVVAAEFIQWMMIVVGDVNQLSLRQAIIPARVQGRVNASVRFLISGAIPIGSLMGGLLGELVGVRATLIVGTAGMLVAAAWVWFSPLRTLREQPAAPHDEWGGA